MKLYRQGMAVDYHLATPADIIAAFNDLPEWTRIRVAAGVIEILDESQTSSGWDALGLILKADQLEREDAEREAAEVEELAQFLINHVYDGEDSSNWGTSTDYQRDTACLDARALIRGGYRKRADDE